MRSSGNSRYNKSFCLKAIKRSGEIRQIQTLCEASKEKNFSRVVFSAPSLLRCKRLLPNCHCDGEPLEMFSCKVPSWVWDWPNSWFVQCTILLSTGGKRWVCRSQWQISTNRGSRHQTESYLCGWVRLGLLFSSPKYQCFWLCWVDAHL